MRIKVYFALFAGIISFVGSTSIGEYVKHVCGSENTCSGSGSTSVPKDSCCRQCECDDFCLEKGTCCDDRSVNSSKNATMQRCLLPIKLATTGRRNKYIDALNRYFVRAYCPYKYENHQIRHKCETDFPDSLNDVQFVSSKDGKIVYKNRHCAACYGEEGVVEWDVVVDQYCIKKAFLGERVRNMPTNASHTKELLLNDCSLWFKRPAITNERCTICFEEEDLISTCAENQPQDDIAEEYTAMCSSDNSSLQFFPERRIHTMGCTNVYCYLCNKRSVMTCDAGNTDKLVEGMVIFLDSSPLTKTDDGVSKTERCSHAEVNDIFFDVCRPIYCQKFHVPVSGVCTSLVASSKLNYEFTFQLVQTSPKSWQQSFFTSLFKPLSEKLRIQRCPICGVSFDRRMNSTDTFILRLVLTTSHRCKIAHVLSVAESLEKQVHSDQNFTLSIENVQVLVKYVSSYERYKELIRNAENLIRLDLVNCPFLSSSRFDNCPKIALSINEYDTLSNKSEVYKYQATRNEHNRFEICYDDYQMMIESLTSNCRKGRPTYIPIIAGATLIMLSKNAR